MKLPKARTENLLEQNLKDETLIYDLTIDKAFNLNETSTIVYKACGQNSTFDELRRKHKFTDEFIFLALDELKRNNLLAEVYKSPFETANRRDVIKKVGLASMMVLPIITGLIAPKAINAASGQPGSPAVGGTPNPFSYQRRLEEACDNLFFSDTCIEGFCKNINTGSYCCTYGAPSQNVFRSGQTSVSDEYNSVNALLDVNAPREDNSACPTIIHCCDSREPYGSVTYTPIEGASNPPGLIRVTTTYSCTCPS